MVLADTSIWITHFRKGDARLQSLLVDIEVACHPFVIGELSCGNLRNRSEILTLLNALPSAKVASQEEFLVFVEQNKLMGSGLGFVDVHLLASAILAGAALWTKDKTLAAHAQRLGVGAVA